MASSVFGKPIHFGSVAAYAKGRLKSKRIRIFVAILVSILVLVVSISSYYLPNRETSTMGEFEVFGFDLKGYTEVEGAVAKSFGFIENNYNISVPVGDSQINSLKIIKGKEKGSAYYDTVIFNGTGKLDILATNITYFAYSTLDPNSTGNLHFSSHVQSMLPQFGIPSGESEIWLWFQPNTLETFSISIGEGNRRELSLDFGAIDGYLTVLGSQNYTLPLKRDRAGIRLAVTIPRNRAYTAEIEGRPSQLVIENWEIVSYVFLRTTGDTNSLVISSPRGELAYGSKSRILLGSQSLLLNEFVGIVHVTPTSNPNLFKVLVRGGVSSIILESAGDKTNLTERFWDIFFPSPVPFPWIGFAFSSAIIVWCFIPSRKDVLILSFIVIFLFGFLGWAIYTEKSEWIQNVLAYAVILVTVIGYLIYKPKETSKTS